MINDISIYMQQLYDTKLKEYYKETLKKDVPVKHTPTIPGKIKVENKEVYIKQVLYNTPATIVFWSDNTKTVAKCQKEDIYNPETGLMICILKKIGFNEIDSWIPDNKNYINTYITLSDVRKKIKKRCKK